MKNKSKLISVVVCMLISLNCWGITITVDDDAPADYSSIQVAIDNSSDTDVIEVQPGTYQERINFNGKKITIKSINPNDINTVLVTIIDGGLAGNVVTIDNGEDELSVLDGLNIKNGSFGVYCFYSNPTIKNCVINNNTKGLSGNNAMPIISDCLIRENSQEGIYHCDGLIDNCNVSENTGSGVVGCDATITNCRITNNGQFGMYNCNGDIIQKCIISFNNSRGVNNCDADIINCIGSA